MNRRTLLAVVGVLIVGAVAWHFVGMGSQSSRSKPTPIPVVTAQVHPRAVPLYLSGIGTVQANNTVVVRARVDGELVNVAFREGQHVKKGDVLAQIDPRPFQAALHTAQANLARDEATLANSKRDLVRIEAVAKEGFASKQQLDTQIAQVDSQTAAVQADKAGVETAQVQLAYTTIVSPLDGITGVRLIDQGNIIHASDPNGLVVITQTQPIAAMFTLPQSAVPTVVKAHAEGPLKVTALSRDDALELGQGNLELIDNQIDPTTGTVRLKAYFPNTDNTLWPGEFINARLQVGDRQDGILIPTQVVQRGVNGTFAYVVRPDNTVEPRPIELGAEYRGEVLVNAGLKGGDVVVVDGQVRLQPGALVAGTDMATVGAHGQTAAAAGNSAP